MEKIYIKDTKNKEQVDQINLSQIDEGKKVLVSGIICKDNIKHRLCSLGILSGQTIEIMKNDSKNPIIVKVFNSKIAVGREQAKSIFVSLA